MRWRGPVRRAGLNRSLQHARAWALAFHTVQIYEGEARVPIVGWAGDGRSTERWTELTERLAKGQTTMISGLYKGLPAHQAGLDRQRHAG